MNVVLVDGWYALEDDNGVLSASRYKDYEYACAVRDKLVKTGAKFIPNLGTLVVPDDFYTMSQIKKRDFQKKTQQRVLHNPSNCAGIRTGRAIRRRAREQKKLDRQGKFLV